VDIQGIGFQSFGELEALFEEHCPGVLDEIQGFTDALDLSPVKLMFWELAYKPIGGSYCSQLAALAPVTVDSHIYLGRNYDWNHLQDDCTLCTTRVKGKSRHVGCSAFLFGRNDGLNEHGLCASFTGGGVFNVELKHAGFAPDIAIRTLLDHCKSVDEALKKVQLMSLCGFFLLLLVDKSGDAALVEHADGAVAVKRITEDSSEPFLCSTNHFTLPDTMNFNSLNVGILDQSIGRHARLLSLFKRKNARIGKDDIKGVLSRAYPRGVCNHYYKQCLGTIWSSIFDITTSSLEICFGAPTHNEWRSVVFNNEPPGITHYDVIFPISNK
ncbi:MAG: C45 family autoproteolytic acyltransferase/hydrolase, partial [Candidatus Odinarchaeota archaeon]